MHHPIMRRTGWLASGALTIAMLTAAAPAVAQEQARAFDIPAGELGAALNAYARQADRQILFTSEDVAGKRSAGLHGRYEPEAALDRLLAGSGLSIVSRQNGVLTLGVGGFQDSSPTNVEELVVTAQKREERLLDVPAPVTAVKTDRLASQGQTRLQDFSARIPGLNVVTDQAGQTAINIRGISTGAINSSTVAIYIDETPFGSSTSYAAGGALTPDLDPASLQRIEVLRGPQGTLYGASALGGLIKYVTVPPSLTTSSGSVETDASAVDGGGKGYGLRGYLNTPIVQDRLGLTLSAFGRHDPGFIDNPQLGKTDVNATDVEGGRLALLWRPTERLSVNLSALLQHTDSQGGSQEEVGGDFQPVGGDLQQVRYIDTPSRSRDQLYNLTLDYDLGWATAKSISSYQRIDANFLTDDTAVFAPIVPFFYPGATNVGIAVRNKVDEHRFSEELRLASPTGRRIEWQGGVFFAHETSTLLNPIELFDTSTRLPLSLPALYDSGGEARYTEYAAFGDVTLHLTSRLSLLGGLRYDGDRQHFDQQADGILAGGPTVVDGKSSDRSATFLVAPRFQLTPDTMVYARIASGYRPGGVNSLVAADIAKGAPATFDPDTLTNYEVGLKGAFFDHALVLELSAFDIEWKRIQVIESVSGIGFIGNGTKARSTGLELAAAWTPLPGLSLAGNLALTDARLTEDAPGVGGLAGEQLPFSPRTAGSASLDYSHPVGAELRAFAGASVNYQGRRQGYFGAPRPQLPAYATVDLRAGVGSSTTDLTLYVRNLADRRGFVNATTESLANGPPFAATLIQPRTIGVSISRRF